MKKKNLLCCFFVSVLAFSAYAQTPQWWADYNVTTNIAETNDYEAVNIGQVKYVASQCAEAVDEAFVGGNGVVINELIDAFSKTNNYAGASLGQLKYVAKPFYDRLVRPYPWTGEASDYSLANAGQLKHLFCFDLAATAESGNPDNVIPLVTNGESSVVIVYGTNQTSQAEFLRGALSTNFGIAVSKVEDSLIVKPGTWLINSTNELIRGKHLIVVGNVLDNLIFRALNGRNIAGANGLYPGPGCYILQMLFSPMRQQQHMIIIGSSDKEGLQAGMERLLSLVPDSGSVTNSYFVAPLIERGNASGPMIRQGNIRNKVEYDAAEFFWYGNIEAGVHAKSMLLDWVNNPANSSLRDFSCPGHYQWKGFYCAVFQLLAGGLFTEEERSAIDEMLLYDLQTVADVDLDARRFLVTNTHHECWSPEDMTADFSRHHLACMISLSMVSEYLHYVADLTNSVQAADVEDKYNTINIYIDAFLDAGVTRSTVSEGPEAVDTASTIADLYYYYGDNRFIEADLLFTMASYYMATIDNLGYHAGFSCYIGSRPGCHYLPAWGGSVLAMANMFSPQSHYQWWIDYKTGYRLRDFLGTQQPPDQFAVYTNDFAGVYPSNEIGVSIVPVNSFIYGLLTNEVQAVEYGGDDHQAVVPLEASRKQAFDRAVFRDGFHADDACLIIEGVNGGAFNRIPFQENSIGRYTELGSLLLFHNSQKHTSWSKNSVSVSRGLHDPQSTACRLKTRVSLPGLASGISSVQEEGGTTWRRNVIRRQGGYFVVMDSMAAHSNDAYNTVCRWRSFHAGKVSTNGVFCAQDAVTGTKFYIQSAAPFEQTLRYEKRDGAARPNILRQFQREDLLAGEQMNYKNLLYAERSDVPRVFSIKELNEQSAVVNGQTTQFVETAIIGSGTSELSRVQCGEAVLRYISNNGLALSGVTNVLLSSLEMASTGRFNFVLSRNGSGFVENISDYAAEIDVTAATPGVWLAGTNEMESGQSLMLNPDDAVVLSYLNSATLFSALSNDLQVVWDGIAFPDWTSLDNGPTNDNPFMTRWGVGNVFEPKLAPHIALSATAFPVVGFTGDASYWVDRMIVTKDTGRDWAGWTAGNAGTIYLDLQEVVPIHTVRMIGLMQQMTNATSAYVADQMSFSVEYSEDGTNYSALLVPAEACDILYQEYEPRYLHTTQFPLYSIGLDEAARYIRIQPQWSNGSYDLLFTEIEIVTTNRDLYTPLNLFTGEFMQVASPGVLAVSGNRMAVFSTNGTTCWQKAFEAPICEANVADVDGDGQTDILAYTLDEKFHVMTGGGSNIFTKDIREHYYPGKIGGTTLTQELRPGCIGAWRPNESNQLEYFFITHTKYNRITACPSNAFNAIPRSGKFTYAVPDMDGDGLEELAVVGQHGDYFVVVSSTSDLSVATSYCTGKGRQGYYTGNKELPCYYDGAVVPDYKTTNHFGLLSLNPGGINFYGSYHDSTYMVFNHFSHPPQSAHLVKNVNDANGSEPELLVGREDGYVLEYNLDGGALLSRTYVGSDVRSLASIRTATNAFRVLVGTGEGVIVCDENMNVVGQTTNSVQQVVVLKDACNLQDLAVVAHDDGSLTALQLP